jgi:hypothetical protein
VKWLNCFKSNLEGKTASDTHLTTKKLVTDAYLKVDKETIEINNSEQLSNIDKLRLLNV